MDNIPYIQEKNGQIWFTENDRGNLDISYRLKSVIFADRSPFQHVMILDSYDFGRMLVLDGVVQTTSLDGFIYNEMISHVPLSFHPNPSTILIIGGGDLGAAREALKDPQVKWVDVVEIDQMVVEACRAHLPEVSGRLRDPRVKFIFRDGVEYIKSHKSRYDIVIVDSSDPVGPAEKLFQMEFYTDVHKALKKDGIMVCQSQSPVFHPNIMYRTYSRVSRLFPNTRLYTAVVPTYPGGLWSFTLGSKVYEKPTRPRNVKARYFNQETLRQCFSLPEFVRLGLPDQKGESEKTAV